MVYTAYLDESDTHGESPTIIMAGVLGSGDQWKQFNLSLLSMRKKHGFNIIHSTDLKRKKGEFRGWTTEQCLSLIKDLVIACDQSLSNGCVISIPHILYRREYRDLPFPKGMKPDSHYGLCFRRCLSQLVNTVRALDNHPILNVVLEAGHANAGDAERIFNEYKTLLAKVGVNNLGKFMTATKHEALPLMVADFFAHSHSIVNRNGWDWSKYTVPEFRADQGAMIHLDLQPSDLHQMKKYFQAWRIEQMEAWRNRKVQD